MDIKKATLIAATLIFSAATQASIITYTFTDLHGEVTSSPNHVFAGAQFSGSIVYDSELSALIHTDLTSGAITGNGASSFLPFSYSWSGVLPVFDAGGIQQSGGPRNPDGVGSFIIDFGDVEMRFGPTEISVPAGQEPLALLMRSEPSWDIITDDGYNYNIAAGHAWSQLTVTEAPIPSSIFSFASGLLLLILRKRSR